MMSQRLRLCVFLACIAGAGASFMKRARENANAAPEKERAALLAFLATRGIELRAVENRSNVIPHMYSVGPEHGKQLQVGFTYFEREPSHADVLARFPIAIPFAINRHWLLWQVGVPGGNARKEFMAAWDRILPAFRDYH